MKYKINTIIKQHIRKSDTILKLNISPKEIMIGGDTDSIMSIIWLPVFLFLILYGQKIQLFMITRNIGKNLVKLEKMKTDARNKVLESLLEHGGEKKYVEKRFDILLESFVIPPIAMDPKGIINKLEHLLDTQEEILKSELQLLAKSANETQLTNLLNLLEVTLGLTLMFKYIRHFYISGKKTGNAFVLAQAQMILHAVMEQAEAYHAAIPSLKSGKPIGDTIGPLITSKLKGDSKSTEIVKNTIVNETSIEDRQIFLIKAKGPGGNVGKPGEAIKKVIENNKDIKLIITIDAALKLEGEKTGEIAEGVGAAIGGPGIERYKIEETATKNKIRYMALVSKMAEKDAITEMKESTLKSAEPLIEKVNQIIKQHTKIKEKIIIAGIGNTMGIE